MESKFKAKLNPVLKKVLIGGGIVVIGGYALLFTGPGNRLIGAYVESMLNSDPKVPITLERFTLQTDYVQMKLRISDVIEADVHGDYALFGGDFNGNYTLHVSDLARLKLEGLKAGGAKGSFNTSGTIKALEDGYEIKGGSDLYGGALDYVLLLEGTAPKSLDATLSGATLSTLMRQAGGMSVADAALSITAHLENLESDKPTGQVTTRITEGRLIPEAYRRVYGSDAPEPFAFGALVVSTLGEGSVRSRIDFDSTYATLDSDEIRVDLNSRALSGSYTATLTPPPSQGVQMQSIQTGGMIVGTVEAARIEGQSALFGSQTHYTLGFVGDTLKSISAQLKGISLEAISRASAQEPSADARIDVDVAIADAREGHLSGTIVSQLSDFKPDAALLKSRYGAEPQGDLNLSMHSKTMLEGSSAWIDSTIESDVGRFEMQRAKLDLSSGYLEGNYTLQSGDFASLAASLGVKAMLPKEAANAKKAQLTGTIRKTDTLHVTGETPLLGGTLSFALEEDALGIKLINAAPEAGSYKARINAVLTHHLKTQKGTVLLSLQQGETLLEVKEARYDAQNIDALIVMSGYGKSLQCSVKGVHERPEVVMKSNRPLISDQYKKMMLREIDANLDDEAQRKQLTKLVGFLSKPEGVLTQKEMREIEASVHQMVAMLKKRYAQVKNITFTPQHLEHLQALSETMRRDKGILSDADIKEVERRSKAIVASIKSEWSSQEHTQERAKALEYFERLGGAMEQTQIDQAKAARYKAELGTAIDAYQAVLGDRVRIERELEKYEAIERVAQMFGESKAFDRARIFELLSSFNAMLETMQQRIAQSDLSSEQQELIREIGRALRQAPATIKAEASVSGQKS